MTPSMQLDPESGLFVSGVPGRPEHDETEAAVPLHRRALRWLERQTASRAEDEVVGAGRGGPPVRLVLPMVSPVLLVPAALLLREPENAGAFVALVAGGFAIAYGALADAADRRMRNPFWLQLFNSLVYAGLISAVLWAFVTLEHPRPHSHWIVFFLYFLLIGASGLSDDPRQCVGTDVVARFGGEEFVVAFLDSDEEGLRPRLETLRQGIERTRLRHLESGSDIRVTVSMGTARFPVDGDSVAEVFACADERLYAAKQAGRNRIVGAPPPAA